MIVNPVNHEIHKHEVGVLASRLSVCLSVGRPSTELNAHAPAPTTILSYATNYVISEQH